MNRYIFDNKTRYQKGLVLNSIYPPIKGFCACGCGISLKGRQTKWASRECNDRVYYEFAIIKGNTGVIRKALHAIDKGFCRQCGVYDSNWQADHIYPVEFGGGACGLDNYQTLCQQCHLEKTRTQIESHRSNISWRIDF
jgi:5-methylcytosine-specific restriction endonuclease McrA